MCLYYIDSTVYYKISSIYYKNVFNGKYLAYRKFPVRASRKHCLVNMAKRNNGKKLIFDVNTRKCIDHEPYNKKKKGFSL